MLFVYVCKLYVCILCFICIYVKYLFIFLNVDYVRGLNYYLNK